jgi:hypothetical protein
METYSNNEFLLLKNDLIAQGFKIGSTETFDEKITKTYNKGVWRVYTVSAKYDNNENKFITYLYKINR